MQNYLKKLRKLIIFTLISVILLNSTKISAFSVKYNEFIDLKSEFRKQFQNFKFEESLLKLLVNCRYDIDSNSYNFKITDIPSVNNKKNEVTVKLKFKDLVPSQIIEILKNSGAINCKLSIYDSNGSKCLNGLFNKTQSGKNKGELASIRVNPQYAPQASYSYKGDIKYKATFAFGGPQRSVNGTALLEIWDSICTALAVGKIKLIDISKVRDLELRLFRPFARADKKTWYGKKGYVPSKLDIKEYENAIEYIWNKPVADIQKDFDNTQVSEIIQKYNSFYNKLKVNLRIGGIYKFGELVSHIFLLYETSTDSEKDYFYEDLKTIYENCIKQYTAEECSDPKLMTYLRKINLINFEKVYKVPYTQLA